MTTLFKARMMDLSCALIHLVIILNVVAFCSGDPDGYTSIDCGSTQGRYIDSRTNLTWEGDEPYTLVGSNGVVSESFWGTVNSTAENYPALRSFRYFPLSRQKYCYELPVRNFNTSFLIRAMFLHGGSHLLPQPIRFQVYINDVQWIQVQYGMDSKNDFDIMHPEVREAIYYAENGTNLKLNLCLVRDISTPFISALELREMNPEVYSEVLTDIWSVRNYLLISFGRWNVAPTGTPTVRYPDDLYDRLWQPPNISESNSPRFTQTQNISKTSLESINSLPDKLAEVAVDLSQGYISLDVEYPIYLEHLSVVCLVLYISTNQSSLKPQIVLQATLDDVSQSFHISNRTSVEYLFAKEIDQSSSSIQLDSLTMVTAELLAVELYLQDEFIEETTLSEDVTFIDMMKQTLNLSNWQGDPCVPMPYDWLTCFQYYASYLTLESITLNYFPNIGRLANLPSNYPTQIKDWSITYSNLDDDTAFFLLTAELSIETQYLFLGEAESNLLQALNVSYNNIAGEVPDTFLSYFTNLTGFQNVYMDHNAIRGTLNFTLWYDLLQATFQHPTSIGESELVLHQLPKMVFSFVNNDISDIIPSVKELESSVNVTLFIEQFSKSQGRLFIISVVVPNIGYNVQAMAFFRLGGNPFCKKAEALLHRFLCRSSIYDTSYAIPRKKSSKVPVIFGIVGGVIILIVGLFLFAIIWRLWRQVTTLQQFQQELLQRKVQPPFFSYHDLKIAIKDFHPNNKLGSGAFGAVYKGVLPDEREVAVKKLFTSNIDKEVQVLNDFLNEVVLITGIKHKNLVQLLGCSINEKERILVYEYAERRNVADALWAITAQLHQAMLTWEERVNICAGIASLSYLHKELQPGIIHRDIKPANILLDKYLNPKIADFGLAKYFQEEETREQFTFFAGTKGYLAPEYILDGILTDKAYVYSFGILTLEIMSGRKCIDSTEPEDKVSLKYWAEMLQERGQLLDLVPNGLLEKCPQGEAMKDINIALLCVHREPHLRPTMPQVAIMLAGTADDTMFLSLSEQQRLSSRMPFHIEAGLGSQHETTSFSMWTGRSSNISCESMDQKEEDALINSKGLKSLPKYLTTDRESGQSGEGLARPTLLQRVMTLSPRLSQSLSRNFRSPRPLDQIDS